MLVVFASLSTSMNQSMSVSLSGQVRPLLLTFSTPDKTNDIRAIAGRREELESGLVGNSRNKCYRKC